jgi:uncharacterized protein (DUF885 family)
LSDPGSAADAEAYLDRLQSFARQLDGELGRMRAAREQGLVPPAFLIDKAMAQMALSIEGARAAARRGLLPLGAPGVDHDDDVAR